MAVCGTGAWERGAGCSPEYESRSKWSACSGTHSPSPVCFSMNISTEVSTSTEKKAKSEFDQSSRSDVPGHQNCPASSGSIRRTRPPDERGRPLQRALVSDAAIIPRLTKECKRTSRGTQRSVHVSQMHWQWGERDVSTVRGPPALFSSAGSGERAYGWRLLLAAARGRGAVSWCS
jgi:hypothetical protein